MKVINNFTKLCTLYLIRAALIYGTILPNAHSSMSVGPYIADKDTNIQKDFIMKHDPICAKAGNRLIYKGKIYESGLQVSKRALEKPDITTKKFDLNEEETYQENEITMFHIILGDALANDYIALLRFTNSNDFYKKLIKADKAHFSEQCIAVMEEETAENIQKFITRHREKITDTTNISNIYALEHKILTAYKSKLVCYESFAKKLNHICSPKKEEWTEATNLSGHDSASHTEIMMIYKILEQCGITYDADSKTSEEDLRKVISSKKEEIKKLLPKNILSHQDMCNTCEHTLAGFYEFLYKDEITQKTINSIFIWNTQKYRQADGKTSHLLGTLSYEMYDAACTIEGGVCKEDPSRNKNRLYLLAKRLVQIDTLLEDPDINENLKKTIRKNKEIIISKYDGIAKKVGMREPTDHTGETLLESLKSFLGSMHATGPGQQPPPPLIPAPSSNHYHKSDKHTHKSSGHHGHSRSYHYSSSPSSSSRSRSRSNHNHHGHKRRDNNGHRKSHHHHHHHKH